MRLRRPDEKTAENMERPEEANAVGVVGPLVALSPVERHVDERHVERSVAARPKRGVVTSEIS